MLPVACWRLFIITRCFIDVDAVAALLLLCYAASYDERQSVLCAMLSPLYAKALC